MTLSPGRIDDIYACSANFVVRERLIADEKLQRFSAALDDLRNTAGEDASDEGWRPVFRALGRLRFDLMAAPVCPGDLGIEAMRERLSPRAAAARAAFPHCAPALARTLEALDALAPATGRPLLEALADEAKRSSGVLPVLLCESRLLGSASAAAAQAGYGERLRWIVPHELRASGGMDALAAIGAPRWFPRHVFDAPRAPDLRAIRHHWLIVDWSRLSEPTFATARTDASSDTPRQPVILRDRTWRPSTARAVAVTEDDMLPPPLDAAHIERGAHPAGGGEGGDTHADAVAVRLEGDDYVLLEDGGRAFIVDPDADNLVRTVPAGDIPPGAFLLLRTEGGGDYIVDVADRALGTQAAPARAKQVLWKTRLHEAVGERGVDSVVQALTGLGSDRANASNLRHWLSPRSIRTDARRDFEAILALTGLEQRADELWSTMGLIRNAHVRAGAIIRRRLIQEVAAADPQYLARSGRLDFELREGGGALTAFRVVGVLPGRVRVSRGRLDQVLSEG